MICPQCGAEHTEEQGRFCAECGLPVMEPAPMTCPHCGAPHNPEQGRFCDACGMSVPRPVVAGEPGGPSAPAGTADDDRPRCRACGTPSDASVCPGCGNRMPSHDD